MKQRPDDFSPDQPDDEPSKDEPDQTDEPKLTPVPTRIGEGPDNLRRRREWFKRRSGEGTDD
ncbi:MAG TPA: hypothetical protein VL693_20410 [Vicinamibacterales bacterium]|nr:hypothetical protein [Vicinamibacterales bacterium]